MADLTQLTSTAPAPRTVTARLLGFAVARLKEASTLRGAVLLISSVCVALSPEQQEAIVSLALAIVGAIGVFFPDEP